MSEHDLRLEEVTPDADADPTYYRLRLYVAGQTLKSLTAIANLKRICETHLGRTIRGRADRPGAEPETGGGGPDIGTPYSRAPAPRAAQAAHW